MCTNGNGRQAQLLNILPYSTQSSSHSWSNLSVTGLKMLSNAVANRPFTSGARPVRPVAATRRALVTVAVKPTKAAEFRGLSNQEIVNKIGDLKLEMASVRFLQRTRGISEMKPGQQQQEQPDPEKVPKAHMGKHIRHQVAQLLTILREREIKEGVSARESRRKAKQAALAVKMAI